MDEVNRQSTGAQAPPKIDDELVEILPRMKAQALYLTRSEDKANDLMQRTCLRALSRSHQFETGTRLDRWVSRIMDSIWFNELRDRKQRQEQELPDPDLVPDNHFEKRVEAQIMISDLRRVCGDISDEDFSLIKNIHCYGYTYQELADELGVPIGTLLSRVSRIKVKITRALAEVD